MAELLGHDPPSPAVWRLEENVALRRALDLQDDVCFPSRLVVSPSVVVGASSRVIEHTCSTFPGMSGGPGVDVKKPWQLLFVHVRADSDFRRNNYSYSVHHPLFVKVRADICLSSLCPLLIRECDGIMISHFVVSLGL